MTQKAHIIDSLGERSLLLPALLNDALAANDRAKYFFALLQTAQGHADHPEAATGDLRAERRAAGIDDDSFDTVAVAAEKQEDSIYRIAQARAICDALAQALRSMLEPLTAADDGCAAQLRARLEALTTTHWYESDDAMSARQIARLVSGDRRRRVDTAHLLVMDLHKALNALQARIAEERIDGAHCYGLHPSDRPAVAAFMRGLNRTKPLKFEHPGLGTTATRAGKRLLLQNDIGTTDAHVLVVHVEATVVTVTYSDVHLQRLLFFQGMFEAWAVEWEDTRSRSDSTMEDGVYHLCVGRFEAGDEAELARYLDFLGSRLVFLIDWNRARKRLRLLLPKKEAAALLKWAAQQDCGHMGFLAVDAAHEIFNTIGFLTRGAVSPDMGLAELLGREAALEFMKFVLRACAEGLLQGRPADLIHDEIRAELVTYFQSVQQSLLDIAVEHAAFSVELAAGVRDCLLRTAEETAAEEFAINAKRAKQWEHSADELVKRARGIVRRGERAEFYFDLIESADDIADDLEDAAFHLTLLAPSGSGRTLFKPLTVLAESLVAGTQEFVKALETSRTIKRGGPRDDMQDFLEAIHRIVATEKASDEAQRAVKSALAATEVNRRQLYAFSECARTLEAAADALMHTGLSLHDYVLGEVLAQ